ncbi:Phytanoyl-CoA dioxygenase domain-containing protein 1 [Candida viswanathii]|uniref:Phytanoyl-CoA dioxygenase domain-containing protein 1 n=1 Tax=Candida viswanathii TaxID=5486 RepID=A0A367YJG8_9ASCO|nr:Phytanoyl-CoA dioxygenase domain-containing protein 1 [Candida viswanathii]
MQMTGLTPEQLETFDREGMLCIPDFLTPEQTQQLLAESQKLLSECDLSTHPKTTFKTADNDHIGDKYFFESSDKVSFFFDTDAFNDEGELQMDLSKAINKIGHGLHIHDEVFNKITFDPKVQGIARSLSYQDPRVLQSMCIFKQPATVKQDERDNAVPPHTDATFLYTQPQSAVGFWYALQDCTMENGCLAYIPGSHKKYPVNKRFVRVDGGEKGCNFEYFEEDPVVDGEYTYVPCKAGSLILINNSVLHKSEKNKSDKSRYAYAFHVIDGVAGYDEKNWLQVPYTGGTNFSKLYT